MTNQINVQVWISVEADTIARGESHIHGMLANCIRNDRNEREGVRDYTIDESWKESNND